MSTSITTTIKPFETCGYLRYTSWEDFFVWAEDFKDGIFPVPESKVHIELANTPPELKNFRASTKCVGIRNAPTRCVWDN